MPKLRPDPQPDPPLPIDVVDELPPPLRERGVSIYDAVILHAHDNPDKWIAVDYGNRTFGAFRMGMIHRLEQLELDMDLKKRGKLAYVRYEGETEDLAAKIREIREQSRAPYETDR